MKFEKYQHIERFGNIETEGIDIGECWIFPKIDGTNGTVFLNDNGDIQAGSRNRGLTLGRDNAGFYAHVITNDLLKRFFQDYPTWRIFGEWLVPHTLRTYREDAWYKFYVFDVTRPKDDSYEYLEYNHYAPIFKAYAIEHIPPIRVVENPSIEKLNLLLEQNTYLIQDGKGSGEGIIIKNYGYRNKYGRQTWAKIVKNEFKDKHWHSERIPEKDKATPEQLIVAKYVNKVLIEKEFAKIESEQNGWTSAYIPRLLQTVYYCLVKEDGWNFIKELKNPTIDFKKLMQLTIYKVKQEKPELF